MNSPARAPINRPLLLYVILVCYVSAPIAVLGLFWHSGGGLPAAVQGLFKVCGPVATALLLVAPVVGVAVFFVFRATWYAFIGHGSLILLNTLVTWIAGPRYNAMTVGSSYQLTMLAGNLMVFATVVLACRRDFRAPYFRSERRGWRRSLRISLRHFVTIDGHQRKITDISTDGCFVAEPDAALAVGQTVSIEFRSRKLRLVCQGGIVKERADGYGVRFLSLPAPIRRDITRAIKRRSAPREECSVPCTITLGGTVQSGVVCDLSPGGCFIQTSLGSLRQRATGSVIVAGVRMPVPLRVVWSGIGGMKEKPTGIGAKFIHASSESLCQLRAVVSVL